MFIENTETPSAETPTIETPTETPVSTQPTGVETPAEPQTSTPEAAKTVEQKTKETIDWLLDPRADKMWKKDPNNLYKSYRNIEKVYDPLKKQTDSLTALFKELELENPELLREIIPEYREFKDPNNPLIKTANYFKSWLDNPVYSPKVEGFFQELEKQELARLYPGMNEEQIKKQVELENKLKTLEEKNNQIETEKMVATYKGEIKQGIDKSKKYAEKVGLAWTDEIHSKLLDYCSKNNISTRYIFQAFIELFGADIEKSFTERHEKEVMEKLNKNKNAVVTSGAKMGRQVSPTGKMSLADKLRGVLEGKQ